MKKLLIIHGVIEMIAGVVLVFSPHLFLMTENQSAGTLTIAKLYGIIAFTFGAVSFMIASKFEYDIVFKRIIMTIVAFHLMVGLQTFAAYQSGLMSHIGAAGLHLSLAVVFVIGYMKEYNFFQIND